MNLLDEVFKTYNDPLDFVRCAYPWREAGTPLETRIIEKWQEELLRKLGEQIKAKEKINPENYVIRAAVKSGQGIGKTACLAWIIQWFLSTHEKPKIVVTANTENQLKNVDWRELSKWHQMLCIRDLFEWTATSFYLKEKPSLWKADAIPYNESRPEAFQGVHEGDVLIVLDEASGIPEIIWDTIEGTIKTGRCIVLAFSNPTKNRGSFREAFGKNAHRWINVTVDSREVSFTNKEEIEEDIRVNGEDSDYIRVRVKGQFPRVGDTQFISGDLVNKCFEFTDMTHHQFNVVIGVDVARGGDDESVICVRQGRKVHGFRCFRGLDGKTLATYVIEEARKWKTSTILVDGIGVGASPYDILRMLGYSPIDVQSGHRADDDVKYFNKRTEMYGKLKATMMEGLDILENKDTLILKEQLECLTYQFTNKIQLKLDRKEDLKKQGFSSPDRADALALTFAFDINEAKESSNSNNIEIRHAGKLTGSQLLKL
jgi:hypothetical protein